jgi:membrane complex biogenesis BtpA family protein
MNDQTNFFHTLNKPVIGMLHLLPLPGTEDYDGKGFNPILDRACEEGRILAAGGIDAILLQNTGDLPPSERGEVETIAYMSVIGAALRREIQTPLGVNILANGASSALAVAHAIDAAFVRIKVYIGAVVTTEGILQGASREALEFRRKVGAEHISIAADVYDRTSAPVGEMPIGIAADLAWRIGHADALVVTGYSVEDSFARMREVKRTLPNSILLAGGGATADNIGQFLSTCDGVIVGSSIKDTGRFVGKVDAMRLARFMEAAHTARAK